MKKMKYLIPILVVSSMSVATFATPILKEIKAHYKQNIQYTLNGDEVLNGKGGLVYEDRVYVPLRDMAELLGVEVDYKDNTVILKEKEFVSNENLPMQEGVMFLGTIKAVNYNEKEVLVLREGQVDTPENYILLRLTDTSLIKDVDSKEISLDMLTVGKSVRGIHDPAMTYSIPAQTNLYELQMTEPLVVEQDNVEIKNMEIMNIDKNSQTIVVQSDKLGEYHIKVTDNTFIKHKMNKRIYRFEDLMVGQVLDIEIPPVMTMIYPPQTTAISITIMDLVD